MNAAPRPYAHLNCALTATGATADADGAPLAISTREDWRRVHGLRERYDAVAIGALTWLRDRPRLSVRRDELGREPRRQPGRVVFAGGRACPLEPDGRPTFVVGGRGPGAGDHAATFIPCAGRALGPPLAALWRHGVRSVLVEGGLVLLRSFLAQRCFDRLTVFVRAGTAGEACEGLRSAFPDLHALDPAADAVLLRFAHGYLLDLRRPAAPPPEDPPCA